MPRPVEMALAEILDENEWASRSVGTMSREQFSNDRSARYIVERSLEIISEATRRIPDSMKRQHSLIDWRGIADIGNFLRHEYHSTSANIIWAVVRNDLPELKQVFAAMQASMDGGN